MTYLALQKDVFDISKVTVVGSPTITSDGVASGFSVGSCIDTNYSINTINSQNLNIDISFTTSSDITTTQYILHSQTYAQLAVFIINGQLRFNVGKNDAWLGDVIVGTVTNNTRYNLNLNFTTSGVTYTLKTNDTIITDFVANKTMLGDTQNMKLRLGVTRSARVPFLGSINLPSFKIYVDNQLVFQPVKPTYLLERRKPTVWNKGQFTIVGNPSISEDGVASGFSSGNYIKANISSLDLTDNFELSFQITTSSDVTTEQSVWGTTCNNQAFVYQIFNGCFRLYYPTGTGQRGIIDFGEVEANKTYNITLSCKNGALTIQNYNKSFSFLGSTITFLYMGSGRLENTTMFKGSIDLKQFKIYTDNNLVFDGGAETYVYDPSKFTVVGSPTITEYGVASGFNTQSFLSLEQSLSGLVNVNCVWTYYNNGLSYAIPFALFMTPSEKTVNPVVVSSNNTLTLDGGINGFIIKEGVTYNLKIVTDLKTFAELYIDDRLISNKYLDYTEDYVYKIYIGTGKNNYPINGSIDLTQFSITVDGKEVFTGAKENYYMLRR